ncbi:hypothetical protein GEW_03877, partial [Pasteurella multocida subsp. gallicida str. Anand1_poultry]
QGLIVGDMQKARRGAWKLCPTKTNPAITRFHSISCEPNLRLFILKATNRENTPVTCSNEVV